MFQPLFLKIQATAEIDSFKQSLFLQSGLYTEDFGIRTQADLERAVEECRVVFQNEYCLIFI